MTLGSLFDGIGGFPLSGAMHGIKPLWASEIEPFPIAVTKKRFPDMVHLGSVTDISGAEIPKVDIITFGSPCQDLSVAGAQKGIHDGARSSLFFEAVRIIKEMRESDRAAGRADEHCRPRFAVWENVPGAFSSNKGRDFQAVLQALCEVADPEAHVPFPEKGKWTGAGSIVGDGYSVAWRVYDAQYWGVPQRRKRIYLVADFASERAGEILFESEGVRGDSAQGGETWEGTAADAEGSPVGDHGIRCLTLGVRRPSAYDAGLALVCAGFKAGQSMAGGIGWQRECAATLSAKCSGTEPTVCVKVFDQQRIGQYGNGESASTLMAREYKDAKDLVVERRPPRKYIVRRLTPLECCRLQGYPDGWTEDVGIADPTQDQIDFFEEIWKRWAEINGAKPKSRSAVVKWLQDPGSDSAEYKAYGNSLAIPCSSDVLGRIARFVKEENYAERPD